MLIFGDKYKNTFSKNQQLINTPYLNKYIRIICHFNNVQQVTKTQPTIIYFTRLTNKSRKNRDHYIAHKVVTRYK